MKNATFQFNNFIVKKSLFELSKNYDAKNLSINFKPSGELNKEEGLFDLFLEIFISDESKRINIELEFIGFYKYQNIEDKKLTNFLYQNAPAILFPYIRAYITTLSTLSGINPIILPTLNLVSLKNELLKNINEIGKIE